MRLNNLINESKKQSIILEGLTEVEVKKIFQEIVDSPENKSTESNEIPVDAKNLIDRKVLEMGKLLYNTNPIANLEASFSGLRSAVTKRLHGNPNAGTTLKIVVSYIKWATADNSKSEFVLKVLSELVYILDDKEHGIKLGDYYLISLTKLMNHLQKKSKTQNESILENLIDDVKGLLVGTNQKVTVDQLIKDWETAGKPIEVNAIADILDNYFDMNIINKYMKIEEPIINLGLNNTTETTETIDKEVQEILTFIKKSKITNEQVVGVIKGLKK